MTTVFFIQDQLEIIDDLRLILELNGFETHIASNGIDSFALATSLNPDIIVTDCQISCIWDTKVAPHAPPLINLEIPIILISTAHPIDDVNYLAMFDAFLQMPFEIEDFIGLVCLYTNSNTDLCEVYA